MKLLLYPTVWLFVALAAAYDAHFAWQYRSMLQQWEQNPIARLAVDHFGLLAVVIFKFGTVLFAGGLAFYCYRRRQGHELPLTVICGGAYAALMMHYFIAFQQSAATQVTLATRY